MTSAIATLEHALRARNRGIQERRAQRDLVDLVSHATARGETHGVRVINISPLGLMCRTDADFLLGEMISVWLPAIKNTPAEVRWTENGRVGMEFRTPIDAHHYDAMLSLIPARRTDW